MTEENYEEEWGKDDWSLEESLAPQETIPDPSPSDKKGNLELILSIIGFALFPLLLLSLALAWKKIENNREEGERSGGRLYLALLLSLVGIGLYLLLIAFILLNQAGII